MKTVDALKIAGIVAAGVAAYLVVTKTAKAGGQVVVAAKEVITKDLNPASPDNIVYSNLSDGFKNSLGKIFDFFGGTDYYADPSNVKTQAPLLAPQTVKKPLPATGAVGGQSSPTFAAGDPRRFDLGATYNTQGQLISPDIYTLNFGKYLQ
jgi:hypothetical protein